jgi:hypothetical protein
MPISLLRPGRSDFTLSAIMPNPAFCNELFRRAVAQRALLSHNQKTNGPVARPVFIPAPTTPGMAGSRNSNRRLFF